VKGIRIAVHDVIGLLQNGETIDTVKANCFPQLTRSRIYDASRDGPREQRQLRPTSRGMTSGRTVPGLRSRGPLPPTGLGASVGGLREQTLS